MPFSRRRRTAASMSPFVSTSARLLSIIGAPVRSRSSLTSAAEISAIATDLLRRNGRLRRGNLLALRGLRRRLRTLRDLLVVAFGNGFPLRGRLHRRRGRRCEVGRRRLLLAGGDAVRDPPPGQGARADRGLR